jgi:hypothetical protein
MEDLLRIGKVARSASRAAEKVQSHDGGVAISTANVSNPPTDAQLTAEFGTVPAGFVRLLDDAGAGSNVYLVGYDGTNWWYVALTQAP